VSQLFNGWHTSHISLQENLETASQRSFSLKGLIWLGQPDGDLRVPSMPGESGSVAHVQFYAQLAARTSAVLWKAQGCSEDFSEITLGAGRRHFKSLKSRLQCFSEGRHVQLFSDHLSIYVLKPSSVPLFNTHKSEL